MAMCMLHESRLRNLPVGWDSDPAMRSDFRIGVLTHVFQVGQNLFRHGERILR
jgi:hypothetical protein